MTYWKQHDRAHVIELCAKVGTTYNYWKHLANRRKRPSVDMARRFVQHSDGKLTLDELLPAKSSMRLADDKKNG
jgi:hypothetical protein